MVTLRDLQTDYSVEDLYDLLEVGMVISENRRLVAKRQEQINATQGVD